VKIRWFVGLAVTVDGRVIRETFNADGTVSSREELK
jgi:hypothetical protein